MPEKLPDISHYWKTVLDTVRDAIMVVSPAGEILTVNLAAEEITGYKAGELVGNRCTVLDCTGCRLHGRGEGPDWCDLFSLGKVRAKRCQIRAKDGHTVHVLKRATVLRDASGRVIGSVEALSDMSEVVRKESEIISLRHSLSSEDGFHGMLGHSTAMRRVFDLVENVAAADVPVLITGESGTGKELIAQALHDLSLRVDRPFIKVNCASLNENLLESELFGHIKGAFTGADRDRVGRFQAAQGGSIFLDEFGDVPLPIQVKLLRVLEDRIIERVGDHTPIPVDVRIITATNRDLHQLMEQGQFRHDLFYRVNVVPIGVPSLRERREDIPVLAGAFLERAALKAAKPISGFAPAAMDALYSYRWPGNVRELKNAVEYASVICRAGEVQKEHLPAQVQSAGGVAAPPASPRPSPPASAAAPPAPAPAPRAVPAPPEDDPVKRELIRALKAAGGNQTKTAALLGVSRMTVWKRMKKYGINLKLGIDDPA